MSAEKESELGKEQSPVWLTVACLWGLLVLFTLYDPGAVRDQAQKSEFLAKQSWLSATFTGATKLSETTGMAALRNGLNHVRSALNEPYILFAESSEAPTDVPPESEAKSSPPPKPREAPIYSHETFAPKQRVLVVGASSIQFAIGTELERRLPLYEGVEVRRFGKLASGLVRPDFYDWPKQIKKLVKQFKPDLMIANFGGNGAQAIPLAKYKEARFKTEAWNQEYAKRVHAVIDIAQSVGADVAFIGMPNMRSKKFARKMRHLNRIQKEAAEEKGAVWVSTWDWTSDSKGKYRKSIRRGKKRGLMRTSDGIHYSKMGARHVIDNFLKVLEPRFSLTLPQAIKTKRHRLTIQATNRTVSYTQYLPNSDSEPKTYLVVTSTATGPGSACPLVTHDEYQSLVDSTGAGLFVMQPCRSVFGTDLSQAAFASVAKANLAIESALVFPRPLGGLEAIDWKSFKTEMQSQFTVTSTPTVDVQE